MQLFFSQFPLSPKAVNLAVCNKAGELSTTADTVFTPVDSCDWFSLAAGVLGDLCKE